MAATGMSVARAIRDILDPKCVSGDANQFPLTHYRLWLAVRTTSLYIPPFIQ